MTDIGYMVFSPTGTLRKKAKRENALAEKKIFNICKYIRSARDVRLSDSARCETFVETWNSEIVCSIYMSELFVFVEMVFTRCHQLVSIIFFSNRLDALQTEGRRSSAMSNNWYFSLDIRCA